MLPRGAAQDAVCTKVAIARVMHCAQELPRGVVRSLWISWVRRLATFAIAAAVLLGSHTATAKEDPVTVTVWPNLCGEPCMLRIVIRAAPHDDNRSLNVELNSEDFFRSSTQQLAGSRDAVVHSMVFRSMPAGEYQVRASVRRQRGHVEAKTVLVLVTPQ
jgi:hypothetical protein